MKPSKNPLITTYRIIRFYLKLDEQQKLNYEQFLFNQFKTYLKSKLKLSHVRLAIWLFLLFILTFYIPLFGDMTNFNYFNIAKSDSVNLLGIIITALATIFGISIAFIVLTLESSKEIFSWHSVRKTFSNERLQELSTIFLGSIIFSVFTLLTLNHRGFTEVTIIAVYVCIYLFIICVLSLIPYVRRILDVISDRDEIVKLSNSIMPGDVTFLARSQGAEEYTLDLENNPLIILSEVGVRSVRRHERFAANWVLQSLFTKFVTDFDKQKDTFTKDNKYNLRDILSGYASVLDDIGTESIRTQDANSLIMIMRFIYHAVLRLTQEDKIYPIYSELHDTATNLITTAINQDFVDGATKSLPYYENIIVAHWTNNAPKEKDLWGLQDPIPENPDYDISLYWDDISSTFIYRLAEFGRLAIDKKQPTFIEKMIMQYYSLSNDLIRNEVFGPRQKGMISSQLEYNKRILLEDSLKSGIERTNRTVLHFAYPNDLVGKAISNNKSYDVIILRNMGDMFVAFAKSDNKFSSVELNELGALGRSLVSKKANEDCEKGLIYIAGIFDDLRKVYQLKADKDPAAAEFYIELHRQINSIYKWQYPVTQKSARIIDEKNTQLKSTYIETIKKFTKLKKAKDFVKQGNRWSEVFRDKA